MKRGEVNVSISNLLIGIVLFGMMIIGLTTVWGDFGTQYGVSSKALSELNQINQIEAEATTASDTLDKESSIWENIVSSGVDSVRSLITLPKRLNTMLEAGIRYLSLPEAVVGPIWVIFGIIVTVTIAYAFIGRKI